MVCRNYKLHKSLNWNYFILVTFQPAAAPNARHIAFIYRSGGMEEREAGNKNHIALF